MTDPVDIDALLISALYGELTPAEEARLAAHLESHPADRAALADLGQTRATFRDSRVLAVQLEPPHSVSALLLQEAARRAPRPARSEGGWFLRFLRPFVAHPAMATATMLVVVAGVAGTLYLRHPEQADQAERAMSMSAPAPRSADSSVVSDKNAGSAPASGSGGYRVGLDEVEQQQADAIARAQVAQQAGKDGRSDERKDQAPVKSASVPKRASGPSGIELRRAEPMPKELDDRQDSAKGDLGRLRADDRVSANEHAQAAGAGAPAGGATGDGAAATLGRAAAQPRPVAPAATPPAAPAPESSSVASADPPARLKAKASAPAAKPAASRPSLARDQAPAQSLAKAATQADDKPASTEDNALLGWAQKRRDQVIAFVRANNCRAAASTATEIYNRAPDYYAANVETDRSVKPCLAYLNSERARVDRSKAAAKRVDALDAPAAAPPELPPAHK